MDRLARGVGGGCPGCGPAIVFRDRDGRCTTRSDPRGHCSVRSHSPTSHANGWATSSPFAATATRCWFAPTGTSRGAAPTRPDSGRGSTARSASAKECSPGDRRLARRKKAATKHAIQDHALRLFVEKGYDATTVEEIAAAAGVSHMTFFRYFPRKEEVVEYDEYDPLLEDLIAARPPDEAPLDRSAQRHPHRTAREFSPPTARRC